MALFLYNIFLVLYKTGVLLSSIRNPKARLWLKGRRHNPEQTALTNDAPNRQVIWMHCASLGEFEQGRPVLEHLKRTYPAAGTVITFFSPSGYEAAKKYTGAGHLLYLPMDSAGNAKRFLDVVRPTLVLWVKYEYWYYYLTEIKKRNIPLLLISAAFTRNQVFFLWYGGFFRRMLRCFSYLFVQTDASRRLLETAGFSGNVYTSGDTRFDRVSEIAGRFEPVKRIEQFCGGRNVIVAGSTWKEDEAVLSQCEVAGSNSCIIIAPHEVSPSRLQTIRQLFKQAILYSELLRRPETASFNQTRVLIIDNIGMLSRLYRYATVAYVGGGFGKNGLHNILEAAVYGKPVLFGPVYGNFPEAGELIEAGGAFSVHDAPSMQLAFDALLNNPGQYASASAAAANYVKSKEGAAEIITSVIMQQRLLEKG